MIFSTYQPSIYEPTYTILYIGKSNKYFTHGKMYKYFGSFNILNGKTNVNLTVYGNKGNMISFNDDYYDYVNDNFKFITEKEKYQHMRMNKLKKISNKYKK